MAKPSLKEAVGQLTVEEKLAEAERLLREATDELARDNPGYESGIADLLNQALDAIDELAMGFVEDVYADD